MQQLRTGQKIVCESCGSTDVTVDPPWYRCNYCNTRHTLPSEVADWLLRKKRGRRLFVLGVIFLILLSVAVGGWLYWRMSPLNTSALKTSLSSSVSPKAEVLGFERAKWRNIVFSRDVFKSLKDLAWAPFGYLVLGERGSGGMRLICMDGQGRERWRRDFGFGFGGKIAVGRNDTVLVSLWGLNEKQRIWLNRNGAILLQKGGGYADVLADGERFIGVSGGFVEAVDSKGEKIWHAVIDDRKIVRRAGMRRNPKTGKMEPFERSFDRTSLKKILPLTNGRYAVLGRREGRVVVVLLSNEGQILAKRTYDFGRIYSWCAAPTDDGGFMMLEGSRTRLYRFDAEATAMWKRRILHLNRSVYLYDMVRDAHGYLVTAMDKGGRILTLRLDREGRLKHRHIFAKEGVRLHPVSLARAKEGYLMAVSTEIHEPFIVYVASDATVDANPKDPTLFKAHKVTSMPGDALFPTTNFQDTSSRPLKTVTLEPSPYLGGWVRKMAVKDDYLFALTGATGVKIFKIEKNGAIKEIGQYRKSTTELVVTPHKIAPKDGKIPKRGTPAYYDRPADLALYRRRLYVADPEHGFYVLNIDNAAAPRPIISAPGLKLHSFALDRLGNVVFFADDRLQSLSWGELVKRAQSLRANDGEGRQRLLALDGGRRLALFIEGMIRLYDADSGRILSRYLSRHGRWFGKPNKVDEQTVAVSVGNRRYEVLRLKNDSIVELVRMPMDTVRAEAVWIDDKKWLCRGGKDGALCYDLSDPYDPKPVLKLQSPSLSGVSALVYDQSAGRLYLAFTGGLAAADLKGW